MSGELADLENDFTNFIDGLWNDLPSNGSSGIDLRVALIQELSEASNP